MKALIIYFNLDLDEEIYTSKEIQLIPTIGQSIFLSHEDKNYRGKVIDIEYELSDENSIVIFLDGNIQWDFDEDCPLENKVKTKKIKQAIDFLQKNGYVSIKECIA